MAYLYHNQIRHIVGNGKCLQRSTAMLDAETSWEELICSSLRAGETIYVDDEHLKNRVVKIAEKIGEKAYVKVLTPELKDKGLFK